MSLELQASVGLTIGDLEKWGTLLSIGSTVTANPSRSIPPVPASAVQDPATRTRHPGLGESTYRKHLADQVRHHLWVGRVHRCLYRGSRHRHRSLPAPCSSGTHTTCHWPSSPRRASPFPSHASYQIR